MRSHYPGQRAQGQEIIKTLVDDPKYNAYDKDIAVVNIFFGKPTTIEYERIKRMTAIDFISSVGGLFGLCLGFSLISFFEILYWFIIRLGRNLLRQENEKNKNFFILCSSGREQKGQDVVPVEVQEAAPPPATYVEEAGREPARCHSAHWVSNLES